MAISDTHFSIKERGNLFHAEFGHMINDGAVVINEGLIFKVYKDRVEIKGRDFATHTDIAYWEIPYNTGDLNEGQIGTALDETKVLDKNGIMRLHCMVAMMGLIKDGNLYMIKIRLPIR
ncbi:hypothetical protein B1222_02000 [Paenibacillus larvae subsp. pulvifaciens]|uniref:hypothetical protein n=1 Tax=Paenibacillus larvae TaxID=1464 RepID=UPI00098F2BEE|nr:hypothetical protein [Paenibacillus larvae]AQT83485.1 hypothetical protein B1222_02000 [Paenibacillus larvae subsp. pulvifaciens]